MWTNRTHPEFTEQDICEINLNFQPTQPGEEITSVERGGGVQEFKQYILEVGF